jgi:peptidoglycan/xylan/chitin deacetylase (PgdA/CDA1 family)
LKIDVDTFIGTRDGIPNLIRILQQFGIRATFYFSLGPDNSGKAIRRIFHRGFLSKMLRTRAPSMYGVRTLLCGTLLPAPIIGKGLPEVMRSVQQAGHEVGIHCWDHVKWHDYLSRFPKQTTFHELDQARNMFEGIFGHRARTTAAPGWTVSVDSLEIQDGMGLSHCSDARGTGPFFPSMAGRRFTTLQIPTTWPTMDELLGENGITLETINDQYLQLLKPGLNVHTIHAELEGNALSATFVNLLQRFTERNVRFITLAEGAAEFGADAPNCELGMEYIAGRAMPVAIQGAPIL